MRPLKLEIEGLQSFEKKQTIDFKTLTEQGLFGIFGKTGSGKSTILDAITLALYGNIVRIDGSKDDKLINLLNINSDKIEITYEFSIGGEKYKIHRRFPKKKVGNELGAQKCLMYKNDEIIGEKTGEIKTKIDELIGLNMDDFTRSVVLPQGKFSEFLKLAGKEKREMLERIFGLEEYGRRFIAKLTSEKNSKWKEVEALTNQIKGKGNIETHEVEGKKEKLKSLIEEKEEFNKKYKKFKDEYREKEEIKKLCDELEEHKKIKEDLEGKKDTIENLKIKISKGEQANEIGKLNKKKEDEEKKLELNKNEKEEQTKKLEELNKEKEKLGEAKEEYHKKEKEYEKLGKELEVDPKEREELNEIIKLKENIDTKTKEIEGKKKRLGKEVEELSLVEEKLKEEEEKLDKVNKNLEKLNEIEKVDITTLKIQNEKLSSEIKEVDELEKEVEKLNKNLEVEKKEKENLKIEIEKFKGLKEVEKAKILNDKAYSLAMELKEGEGCPVCGSKEHPNLANPSIDTNEELLEELNEELEKLNSKYHKLNPEKIVEEIEGKISKLDNRNSEKLKKEFKLKVKEIEEKEESNNKLEDEIKSLEKKNTNLEKEIAGLKKELENIKKNIERYKEEKNNLEKELGEKEEELKTKFILNLVKESVENLKIKYRELTENEKKSKEYKELEKETRGNKEKITSEIIKIDGEISKVKNKLSGIEKEFELLTEHLEEVKKEMEKAIEKSKFETIKEVLDSIISEDELEKYKLEIENFNKKVIENNGLIENTDKKLGGRGITLEEWEKLKKEKSENEEKETELTKDITTLNKEVMDMEKKMEEIGELLKEKKENEEKYFILEELSKLFKGNAFVEYLALGKLRNITKHASKRLGKITSNRYGIEVGKNAEFLIVDNFNGGVKRRSATLSGGETFLVSLSLALALSNQIQLKGKSNLEFFFLDEGFGTLDTETLEKVMSSLENLKEDEKLTIGIITHVEDLKERVPRKLEVLEPISGERGSEVKVVY